jgi:hypothetical protein
MPGGRATALVLTIGPGSARFLAIARTLDVGSYVLCPGVIVPVS